jgi:glycosyltransferase involved in cell wall biosynthesis
VRSLKSLSIIVPTPDGGRLDRLADSLRKKLYPGDEVIVVGDTTDGPLDAVEAFVGQQPQWRYLDGQSTEHSWGHREINRGIEDARGDYLVFQDDDDVFAGDAIANIHRAIRRLDPPRPHLFRFRAARYAGGMTIWQQQGRVEEGWIGGHCIVTPNVPERTGRWTDRYAGDFDFIAETLRLWEPLEPIWRPEVITLAR